jgi:hypothetical protein
MMNRSNRTYALTVEVRVVSEHSAPRHASATFRFLPTCISLRWNRLVLSASESAANFACLGSLRREVALNLASLRLLLPLCLFLSASCNYLLPSLSISDDGGTSATGTTEKSDAGSDRGPSADANSSVSDLDSLPLPITDPSRTRWAAYDDVITNGGQLLVNGKGIVVTKDGDVTTALNYRNGTVLGSDTLKNGARTAYWLLDSRTGLPGKTDEYTVAGDVSTEVTMLDTGRTGTMTERITRTVNIKTGQGTITWENLIDGHWAVTASSNEVDDDDAS